MLKKNLNLFQKVEFLILYLMEKYMFVLLFLINIKMKKKKITLKKKAKAKIGATLLPLTTLDKLTYSTSDKKIATVKKGVITAMGKGKATITVKAGKKTIKIKVNVTK